MPIIPRYQQQFDPNEPPRIDFGDRLIQGLMAGAQIRRSQEEAEFRRQYGERLKREGELEEQDRARAQQGMEDAARMEEFFAMRQVGAQQPTAPQGPMPSLVIAQAPAMGGVLSQQQQPSPVPPSDLEGAQMFASQLKTDSARAMFYSRYREALKNDRVMADVRKTQDAYGNLIAGVQSNTNLLDATTGKSIFDTQITGLSTLLDQLDDEGQTADSRAALTSSVAQAVNQLQKMANDEETRITRYGVALNDLDAAINSAKANSPEARALIEQRSQFKNRPKATVQEIDALQTSISNISAGRTQYSEKLGDWFTPEERVRRETEMDANQRKAASAEVQQAQLEGQVALMDMALQGQSVDIEGKLQDIVTGVFGRQFSEDPLTGERVLAIDPAAFRAPEAIEADLRKTLSNVPQFFHKNRRMTLEGARDGAEDIASALADDIVSGGEKRPETPSTSEQKQEKQEPPAAEAVKIPVSKSEIGAMKDMRSSLQSAGIASDESLKEYDRRISEAESFNARYADLSKKYPANYFAELELLRRRAVNKGNAGEAEEIASLIAIRNRMPDMQKFGYGKGATLSDEQLVSEYNAIQQRYKSLASMSGAYFGMKGL